MSIHKDKILEEQEAILRRSALDDWQVRWGIGSVAMAELHQAMVLETKAAAVSSTAPEQTVQNAIRVEAADKGLVLWRNNVGLAFDNKGNPIRFGLANDSQKINRRIKSSDLIGIRPVKIEEQHVGMLFGQFVAREVKRPEWKYAGTDHEKAQAKFLELVAMYGGDSGFANNTGTL